MGGPEADSTATEKRPDGGILQRGDASIARDDEAAWAHEQPTTDRHELPGSFRVGEYHEYQHDDRWTAADAPLSADGDGEIDWLASDEWLAYDVDIRESGPYDLTLQVAAAAEFGGGDVGIAVDDEPLRRVEFDATGGWYSWDEVTTQVELPRGLHTVRLVVFEGGWKLRKLRFR